MIHVVVFHIIQGLICLYAFAAGGRPERLVAALLLLASLATLALPFQPNVTFHTVQFAAVRIDLVLMACLTAVAIRANRFWPLWLSALHLIGIAIHGVKAYHPDLVPWMYAGAAGKIAYPMLLLLVIGVWRHRKRLAEYGADPDWSPFAW